MSSSTITVDVGNSDGNGDYGDSWITDSYAGLSSVTLSDGVFTATGIFAGLNWQLDNPSDPEQATLSPTDMGALTSGLGLDYTIHSSAISSTGSYYEELDTSEVLDDVEQSVPEPASLSVFAVVLLIAATDRRAARK